MGGGEHVFDAKKFPDPSLMAFMFFRYRLQLFKKIQDPPSNITPKYESFLLLLKMVGMAS